MVIDCNGCTMRDIACGDCVVSVLLGPMDGLDGAEQAALAILADGGLVPPLRMRPHARPSREPEMEAASAASQRLKFG